ncbi:MAG TPA: hypothetical protein VMZ53_07875 [Kofleriaceae bacterium]|nr:hypothetical protein [Kofleriaceae bacterium]
MSRHVRCALALSLGLGIAGCSHKKVEITQSFTMTPGPIERLTVFISMPEGRDYGVYPGFKRVMTSELAACKVASQVFVGLPPEASDAAAPSTRDPQLVVKARYGVLESTKVVNQRGALLDDKGVTNVKADFWMELREPPQDRVSWRAFAKMESDPGSGGGEAFAESIVARLKSDGVLHGCR